MFQDIVRSDEEDYDDGQPTDKRQRLLWVTCWWKTCVN